MSDTPNDLTPAEPVSEMTEPVLEAAEPVLEAAPATVTYYQYAPVNGLMVYSGPVTVNVGDPQPANTSEWEPHPAPTGMVSYFDGFGWVMGADSNTITLDAHRAMALNKAVVDFNKFVTSLNSQYPQNEIMSWDQQVQAAQDLLSKGTASTLLTNMATARGMTPSALAQAIITNWQAYTSAYGTALGNYQKERDAINAATSHAELPAYTLEQILQN